MSSSAELPRSPPQVFVHPRLVVGHITRAKSPPIGDREQPTCTRCVHSGLECKQGLNVRFRHEANPSVETKKGSLDTFADDQEWVSTSGCLTFVDETLDTIAVCDPTEHPELPELTPTIACTPPPEPPFRTPTQLVQSPHQTPASPSTPLQSLLPHLPSPPQQYSSSSQHVPSPSQHISVSATHDSVQGSPLEYLSPINTWALRDQASTWQSIESPTGSTSAPPAIKAPGYLRDETEAELLRYFVNVLASSFDLTDPQCHFRFTVPQQAMTDPVLLNAILAVAARHQARVGNGDPLVADKYHQECLQYLIPVLNDSSAVLGENLLASTIILRHLEEIDVPLTASNPTKIEQASHLIGTHAFIIAQESFTLFGGLRLASFWVGLRQEIYVAFVKQRPILLPLEVFIRDQSYAAADDGTWANRSVALCAQVISCCFGKAQDFHARFSDLFQYAQNWLLHTPSSYTPMFRQEDASKGPFPRIMYCSDAVVTGIQHYHLAMILLLAHDVNVPRLGLQRKAALDKADKAIISHVRELCGLALGNRGCPPNFVAASMAIAVAGDKFRDLEEQLECLMVLEITHREHGWQTNTAQEDLKIAWEWESSET